MSRSNPHRKWPAIDIVSLYSKADAAGWNKFLTKLLATHDVEGLKKTLYGVQAGMADIAKQGIADDKIKLWFFRIQRSLEDTAKKIFREKYPHPLDNPLNAKDSTAMAFHEVKKKRDQEFERLLREARF